jgi:hypothetical protein
MAGSKEVGKVSIRVIPDLDRFREELQGELEKLERKVADIRVGADTSRLRDEVRAATANLPDAKVKVSAANAVKVPVEPEADQARVRSFLAGFARGLRGQAVKVPVEVDVDNNSVRRSLVRFSAAFTTATAGFGATALRGFNRVSSSLSGLQRGFSGAANSMAKFGEAGAIVAAVVALAAPALSLATGALVALPGLLAAAVVPASVLALGMDGIAKAAEAVKPAFDNLKTAVSGAFEKGLQEPFRKVGEFIPKIQGQLANVATVLSNAFGGVVDVVTSGAGLESVRTIIDNISSAITRATPGFQAFTNGLLNLTRGLSGSFLNGLADSFSRIGNEFSTWVDKITANGQLDSAMQNLKAVLGEIGGTIKDIAAWSFDNLSDPAFGQKMKDFAADLRSIVNDILPLLKSGFEDVATIISGIVDTIDKIKDVAATFERITGAKQDLDTSQKQTEGFLGLFGKDGVLGDKAPFRQFFGEAPKAAAEAGSEAARQFQQNLSAAASTATDGGAGLTEAINNQLSAAVNVSKQAQAEALKSAFTGTGVTDAVKAQIGTQMTGVITEAQAAVTQLGPVLQQGIDQAVLPLSTLPAKVGQAFGALAPAITGAWGVIQQTVTAGVTQLNTAISTAFQQLPLTATTAFQGVQTSITGAFGFMVLSIGQQAGNITNAVQQAFNQIPAVITGALGQAVSAVGAAGSQITTAFQASIGQLPTLAQTSFTGLVTSAQTAMNDLVSAVTNGGSQAVAAVQGWSGQITSALQSLSASARASGEAVGREFAGGISSQSGAVAAAAQSLMAAARQFFPNSPADKGPFAGSGWVDRSGEAIGTGFAGGIKGAVGEVVGIARLMMQQVKDVFGNAEGVVFNFNLGEATSSVNQFSGGLSGLQSQVSALAVPAQDFRQSMDGAAASLAPLSTSESKQQVAELTQRLAELEIARKQAELAKGAPNADKAAIKAQLEQIRNQKTALGLQRDQLAYAQKYGGQMSSTSQGYQDQIKSLQKMPLDFATANGNQFLSDLGWSGQGAIPSLMQQGLDYASNFVFNVANMDDALSGQRTLQNRQMQATIGR